MSSWNLGARLVLPAMAGSAGVSGDFVSGVDLIRAPAAGVSNLAAVIGDSLTEHAFRSTPIYWQNGRLGAPLDIIANSGYSGQSISGLRAQIANDYKSGAPAGVDGLAALGWVFVRIGTNGYRGSGSLGSIDGATQADYLDIISQLKTYAAHVVCHPIPPIVGITNADQPRKVWNAFCRSAVEADTSGLVHWIDDTTDLESGGGGIADYFEVDGYHMNGAGAYQMGLTAEPLLTALFANQGYARAPLVTSAADVYPAQPQWTTNPTNTGTSGGFGAGWSGTAPTGWGVSTNGSGIGGVVSIEAADGGDSNTVPWVRIKPSTSSTAQISVTMDAAGRSITDIDPSTIEQLIEVRFNSLVNFRQLEEWIQNNSGNKFTQVAYLKWGASGASGTAVLRQRYYRNGNTAGGTPQSYVYIYGANSASGEMGSIDLRCWSVRG